MVEAVVVAVVDVVASTALVVDATVVAVVVVVTTSVGVGSIETVSSTVVSDEDAPVEIVSVEPHAATASVPRSSAQRRDKPVIIVGRGGCLCGSPKLRWV